MNLKIFILTFCLLVVFNSSAAIEDANIYSLNALYVIHQNNSVDETIDFTFSTAVNKSILYTIDNNISSLYVSDGEKELNYTIIESPTKYLLNISPNESITKLSISYTSTNDIFQKESISFFYTDFNFNNPVNKMEIRISLPPGFSVYNEEYSPKDATIISDGENIALAWGETNVIKSVSFSVRFHDANVQIIINNSTNTSDINNTGTDIKKFFPLVFGFPAFIIILAIAAILIAIKKLGKKANEGLLKGFMEDEQKAILYLQKNKETWQNKLRHEFKFSRAKTTRIIKKLEDKGLVKKEIYGKTNKLFWLK
jgi:uncharacterized membrane protein